MLVPFGVSFAGIRAVDVARELALEVTGVWHFVCAMLCRAVRSRMRRGRQRRMRVFQITALNNFNVVVNPWARIRARGRGSFFDDALARRTVRAMIGISPTCSFVGAGRLCARSVAFGPYSVNV